PRDDGRGSQRAMMDFARQQRDPTRHLIGIAFVVLVHALVIWALITGLGTQMVEVIKKPLSATIIEEIKAPPPPPPPPPPKKIIEPPKVQVQQPYVPPPDIPPPVPTPSEPPRVFDRVVRETLSDWKCTGEGAKYQASVEINFTLKDE